MIRNRNNNLIKRKKLLHNNNDRLIANVVSQLNSEVKGSPHSLLELSCKQWMRIKSNSIYVNDITVSESSTNIRSVTYNNIVLGNKVILRKKTGINKGRKYQWKTPMLGNITDSVVAIVSCKKELLEFNSRIIITDGCRLKSTNDNEDSSKEYQSSGIVLLMLSKWDRESTKSSYSWDAKDVAKLKQCKSNIITARTSHFGSTGLYFSYGNRGNYGMVNNSSVTQYAHKKFKNQQKSQKSFDTAHTFDLLSAIDLKQGVTSLTSVIPSLKDHIAPTLNVIHNLQCSNLDLNMKQTSVSDKGMWQNSICVNCETTDLRTEKDCTYTVITIPNQKEKRVPYFIFELKKGFTIGLKMDHGLTFLFSGQHLFHRQMLLDEIPASESNFFNFASYGSARLFNHLKNTLKRSNA